VTLAIVIIALLVLLVIVDGSEASGANRGLPPDLQSLQAEEREPSQAGSACVLKVTSFLRRNPPEQRRQSWKPARQGQEQVQTTRR
jgi:hypothetical protein